jgi:hypothetical protein
MKKSKPIVQYPVIPFRASHPQFFEVDLVEEAQPIPNKAINNKAKNVLFICITVLCGTKVKKFFQ